MLCRQEMDQIRPEILWIWFFHTLCRFLGTLLIILLFLGMLLLYFAALIRKNNKVILKSAILRRSRSKREQNTNYEDISWKFDTGLNNRKAMLFLMFSVSQQVIKINEHFACQESRLSVHSGHFISFPR